MINAEFEDRIKRYEGAGFTREKAVGYARAIDSQHEVATNPRPLTEDDLRWLRAISAVNWKDLFTEFR